MLRELHIANLAVIADARVELDRGLNCFTGQTGAGKSLVIGALEILLGLRQAQDMLRKGASEGRVTGIFHIQSPALRKQLALVTDLPLEDEPELRVMRRLHESGRTSASVNGNPVTGSMLKAVGEVLVDVHGQHDQQYLLKPANQLGVIDAFGQSENLRRQFSELFAQRQQLVAQQTELSASRTLRGQQLDLFEFQAKEIDDAELAAGEHEALQARNRVLSNLERIKKQAGAAYGALYEEEGAVLERLRIISAVLMELAELDEALSPLSQQLKEVGVVLDDSAFSLRRYVDRLELDPGELAEVNERLTLVTRLIDKYGPANGSLDDLLIYRAQIGKEIESLRSQDEDFSSIGEQIAAAEKKLILCGQQLSAARKKAAARLIPLIQAQLADLGMKEARFNIELAPVASAPSGWESAEFMIAPNPGLPARPLRKIASGGELSRIMLALKSILAEADRVSVLVFDEIDANVGGRLGAVIGEKLRNLARVQQVLCITHLPQIAAYADRHVTIRKKTEGGESYTTVTALDGAPRIHELAEMITGKSFTETSVAQAEELLNLAHADGQKKTMAASIASKKNRK